MVDSILYLLRSWLGEDNWFLLFLLWLYEKVWVETINLYEWIFGLIIWFIYIVSYVRIIRLNAIDDEMSLLDILDNNWMKIWINIFVTTALIFMIISNGFIIQQIGDLILYLNSSKWWLGILFWYDTQWTLYGYYNIFRWSVLIIIFLFVSYQAFLLFSIWESEEGIGRSVLVKNGLIALWIFYIICFSFIPDLILSNFWTVPQE